MRIRFRASYFSEVAKTTLLFVCVNEAGFLLFENGRGDGTRSICVLARVILQQFS